MSTASSLADFAARLQAFIARPDPAGAAFNRLALDLFRLQFEAVPIYRELCQSRRATPDTVARWNDIPALPTESFKDFECTSLAPADRAAVFHSSGTTGHRPSHHFHSADSLALYEASLQPWFQRHFLPAPAALSLLILTPSPAAAPHSSLAYMFDTIARAFPWQSVECAGRVAADGAWELDAPRAIEWLRASSSPVAVLGAAYTFVHLLDNLGGARLALAPGSQALETGGYKGRSREMPKAALHQLIHRQLRIHPTRIVCEYGMSELSSQAYDRVAGAAAGAFHFPPWARAEVVSPETGRAVDDGESGLIRVFDLANVRSVFAVQTGDLAIRRGPGFELLGRAETVEPRGCSLMIA